MKATSVLLELAEAFCSTDTCAIGEDVIRRGGIMEAADYCANLAGEQDRYSALDSWEGRQALREAIIGLVVGRNSGSK